MEGPQRNGRRLPIRLVPVLCLLAVVSACWPSHRRIPAPPRVVTTTTTTTSTTTTTTTEPPNDLLAPPPTEVPVLAPTDGMAPQISRVPTSDRVIFITIDDGQFRDYPSLDHLQALGVPFTSFLLEPIIRLDPAFWQRTLEMGGSIQNHSITHANLRRVSEEQMRNEICVPAATITTATGKPPTLFRPPYGNWNDAVRHIAAECGYKAVVLWTGRTMDGHLELQQSALAPGDIILLHYGPTLSADLDAVVAAAREQGFKIARLEDYLG